MSNSHAPHLHKAVVPLGWCLVGCDRLPQSVKSLAEYGFLLHHHGSPGTEEPEALVILCGRDCLNANFQPLAVPSLVIGPLTSVQRANAISSGFDDAVANDCETGEIAARLHRLLRWRGQAKTGFAVGPLRFDLVRREAAIKGNRLRLNPREFSLLLHLARRNEAVCREELRREIWRIGFDPGTNSIDVTICRLRQKLRETLSLDIIQTVQSYGYRLALERPVLKNPSRESASPDAPPIASPRSSGYAV